MSESFMERVLVGEAIWMDADDWVERWHQEGGLGVALHEYLGMTWNEYRLWTERPEALRFIIAAREEGSPVEYVVERSAKEPAVAARGISPSDAQAIKRWLTETGRLKS